MRRAALVVAAVAVLTHVTALSAGFVWLDHAHLEGGSAVAPLGHVFSLFGHGFAGTGYYRPLMAVLLSIDAAIGGPFVFHLMNVAWHAAAAAMTTIAGGALGLTKRAATFAGIFFAIHPLSSLVADAIAFRSEAIVAAALLFLVWAHLRRRPVLAGVAVLVSALTKESGMALAPLFVIALELERNVQKPRHARLFLAEGVALAACLALRLGFAPTWRASPAPLDASAALGTRSAALAKSAAAVALPIERTICDAFPITQAWQPPALAGIAVAAAIAVLAWRARGAAVLLALSIVPALQIVPVTRWWSPHYLYVPLAFVAIVGAPFVERAVPTSNRRRSIALAALATALGALTLHDGLRYGDDATLWTYEVQHQAACREGQFYLGEVERSARRWDAAAARYEAALAPRPRILAFVDEGAALQNLGTVRIEQSRFADARRAFVRALEGARDPARRRELTHDLASATLADGDPEETLRLLADEVARADAMPESLVVDAMALERLGRVDEARAVRARLAPH